MTVSLTRKETIWGWSYFLFQLLVLPSLVTTINHIAGAPWDMTTLNLIFFCVNYLAVLLICRRFLLENLRTATPGRLLLTACMGFVGYWLSSYAISLFIVSIYPDFQNVNDQSIAQMVKSDFLLSAIGTIALVPLAEEVFYRGILFGSLYRLHRVVAYTISVLVFCLIHVVQYIGVYPVDLLALCMLQYVPAGLCLAWAYEKADTILCPILIHTAINAIGVYAMR